MSTNPDYVAYEAAMAGWNTAIIDEEANYNKARLAGDIDEMTRASQALAATRVAMREHQVMAQEHAARLRPDPRSNPDYLTPEERAVARSGFQSEDISDEQRDQIYAENRRRYHFNKSRGYHDQSQGNSGR